MSTDEQKSVIGGVVLEYGQVKQQLAASGAAIQTALQAARHAEEAVRFRSLGNVTTTDEEVNARLKEWPTAERLRELLAELKTLSERKSSLEQTMKEYGIQL